MGETSARNKAISSPTELETTGFIRLRGRILGSGRVGKRAGLIALGTLVALIGLITYGVSLNGYRRPLLARQPSADPAPQVANTSWWHGQSDALRLASPIPQASAPSLRTIDRLPEGVPDLSQPEGAPPALPVAQARMLSTSAGVARYPLANIPPIPPIEELPSTITTSSAVEVAQGPDGRNKTDQQDAVRNAAMKASFIVGALPSKNGISSPGGSPVLGPSSADLRSTTRRPMSGSNEPTTPADSPFRISAGTIIPAALITAIDSDLPGLLVAQVRQSTYDSPTGQYLLIPQGAKIVGAYDSRIAFGQDRVLVSWRRLIYPDGSGVDLQDMVGTDLAGRSGFEAQVNSHTKKLFQGALLLSIIGAGAQLSQPSQPSTINSGPNVGQVIAGSVGGQIATVATQQAQRQLNVAPNLRVPTGYQFNVIVDHDLVFSAPYGRD